MMYCFPYTSTRVGVSGREPTLGRRNRCYEAPVLERGRGPGLVGAIIVVAIQLALTAFLLVDHERAVVVYDLGNWNVSIITQGLAC